MPTDRPILSRPRTGSVPGDSPGCPIQVPILRANSGRDAQSLLSRAPVTRPAGIQSDAHSFRFHCLLILGFVYARGLTDRDFGPVWRAEEQTSKGPLQNDNVKAVMPPTAPPSAIPLPSAPLGFLRRIYYALLGYYQAAGES